MSPQNLYADLDKPNKEYLLLSKHMFKCFKELGAEYIEALFPKFDQIQYELIKERWDNMILTSRKVIDGRIPPDKAEKTVLYTLPHIISLRSTLQTGFIKLLYGTSVDVTAVMVDDFNWQVVTAFNGHMEDGIPVDWWVIGMEDELMDRRHLKRGMKFKEIYEVTKNVQKTAQFMMELLRDVRNERTPQWSFSLYTLVIIHTSGLFNFFTELSNYEVIGGIWEGLNSKKKFKTPDHFFLMYPYPPMIKSLVMLPRGGYISRLADLTTGKYLNLNNIEEPALEWIKEEIPEAYKSVLLDDWEEGWPLPQATLQCKIPTDLNKILTPDEKLNWNYPPHKRITMDTFGLTSDDAWKGYLTDITSETPLDAELSKDNLISKGFGRNTEYLK
ncbi:MAG: hypothetical protein HWN67_13770 [Candidatus Helarchaeota archaeon]|nr:hypothetical protein [Candidatus Helarchaeota archaeon]